MYVCCLLYRIVAISMAHAMTTYEDYELRQPFRTRAIYRTSASSRASPTTGPRFQRALPSFPLPTTCLFAPMRGAVLDR